MGMWAQEPWANDAAADWFDATFELTQLSEHVEETLNLRIEQHAQQIRAAAHVISVLGENYIWPSSSRVRCIKLAVSRLQEMVDERIVMNSALVKRCVFVPQDRSHNAPLPRSRICSDPAYSLISATHGATSALPNFAMLSVTRLRTWTRIRRAIP